MLSSRLTAAATLRVTHPWVTLSEAISYADASTVQGRAFASRSGFFGFDFSRNDIAFGWAWYAMLWAPVDRKQVAKLGYAARLATEDREVKRAYGAIVRKHHDLLIGFERYARRARKAGRKCPAWPGLWNMKPSITGGERATIAAWLASHDLLTACILLAPESR
jgi:hypothetical protein